MTQPKWTLPSVTIDVPDDGHGSGRLAIFERGLERTAFRVCAIHGYSDRPPYSFADWTRPNGDSSRRYGEPHAIRIDGAYCPEVIVDALLAGLNNESISPTKPGT